MTARFHREEHVETSHLQGKQVAILGYGNQGRAQGLNLRDQGIDVLVYSRPGGASEAQAVQDGFKPIDLSEPWQGDYLVATLPDEVISDVLTDSRLALIRDGTTLVFAHGFALRFGFVQPKQGLDVVVVSPKGPGRLLRSRFLAGDGLFGMVAVHQDATGLAMARALAYGWGIGCARRGILESTIEEEADVDLFGEQVVLCGGIPSLFLAAVDTLIEAGYAPEAAYIDCVHEIQLIADLIAERGLEGMRSAISDTAEFGGYRAGERLVDSRTRQVMRDLLAEVRSGAFAEEWMGEARSGKPYLNRHRESEAEHAANQAFRALRPYLAEDRPADAES